MRRKRCSFIVSLFLLGVLISNAKTAAQDIEGESAADDFDLSLIYGMPFDQELCEADNCEINKTWTSQEKCAYIRCNKDSCEGGGYLQWSEYVKCNHSVGTRVIIIIVAIIYLFILFLIMTVTADDYFSPSISGIVSHLRMSESIAGVTFLAFGNGAPDVFGSIASVLTTPSPKADLALGDLFGGGIFVTCVVLSAIIFTKSFKVAIIPTLRDLLFFMIALAFIFVCFLKFDHIEVWMPATYLGIYACYVATVILFSIHRKRRKSEKLKKQEEDSTNSMTISRPDSAASTVPIFDALRLKENKISMSTLLNFMIGYSKFIQNIHRLNRNGKKSANSPPPTKAESKNEAKVSNLESGINSERPTSFVNRAFVPDNPLESVDSLTNKNPRGSVLFKQETFDTDNDILDAANDDDSDEGQEAEFVIAHGTVFTSHGQASIAGSDFEKIIVTSWKSTTWIRDVWQHLKPWPTLEEFRESNIFSKILTIIKIVPVFFFNVTIPSNEKPWSKPLLILHLFASIQFALFAIKILNTRPFDGSPGLWLYGLGVSLILSLVVLAVCPLSTEQKYYKEIYSYLGFLMSIAWIYVTSKEIVGVITMIGVVTGLSQELLGLTVLAWSNCIGDVVADIAVVKQGFPKMAMAAAIGGPLFNLLIGFGLPFTIAAAQGKQIELLINPVYRLLMLFLAISLVTTFIALFVQRFYVRRPHAVVLIIIFIAYLIFIILAEFHVLEWK